MEVHVLSAAIAAQKDFWTTPRPMTPDSEPKRTIIVGEKGKGMTYSETAVITTFMALVLVAVVKLSAITSVQVRSLHRFAEKKMTRERQLSKSGCVT